MVKGCSHSGALSARDGRSAPHRVQHRRRQTHAVAGGWIDLDRGSGNPSARGAASRRAIPQHLAGRPSRRLHLRRSRPRRGVPHDPAGRRWASGRFPRTAAMDAHHPAGRRGGLSRARRCLHVGADQSGRRRGQDWPTQEAVRLGRRVEARSTPSPPTACAAWPPCRRASPPASRAFQSYNTGSASSRHRQR